MLRPDPIATARLVIRPRERRDLEAYQAWPSYGEPLLDTLRYPQRTRDEISLQWLVDQLLTEVAHWTVICEETIIGTITLSRINEQEGSGQLGIVFGAPYVGQGLGREALNGYLHAYFGPWEMQTITLEVTHWNRRALHLYERLGFRLAETYWRAVGVPDDYHFLDEKKYEEFRDVFRRGNDAIYAATARMVLDRETWLAAASSPLP